MNRFTTITAKAMPMPLNDVDTDMIIPAQFLTAISRQGYGENLFRRLRDSDSSFPMNQKNFSDAQILIAGNNFGCGSSREHAVWALTGAGFKVVIAKSFADIFFNNSAKNGLLLVTLPERVVDEMARAAAGGDYFLNVDLIEQTVSQKQKTSAPISGKVPFDYDPFRKYCLINGLDDLDYILSATTDINGFRRWQKIMPTPTFSSPDATSAIA